MIRYSGVFQRLSLVVLLSASLQGFSFGASSIDDAVRLENDGSWQDAYSAYQELYQQEPGNYSVLINLARLTSWKRDFPQAITYYQEALAAANTPEEKLAAQLGHSEILVWQGQYPQAYELLKPLADAYPENPEPRYRLAQVEAYQLNVHNAQDLYEQNLAKFPSHNPSRLGVAEVYAWKGKYRKAMDIYDDLMQADSDNPKVWIGVGKAEAWRGDLLASKRTLARAKERFPENRDVLAAYARTTSYLGRPSADIFDRSVITPAPNVATIPGQVSKTVSADAGKPARDELAQEEYQEKLLRRPLFQSFNIPHTEAGNIDQKLIFHKITNRLSFFPTPDSEVDMIFEPAYYSSGADIQHANRFLYGLGGSKGWTEQVRTGGEIALADFSNGGSMPLLGRAYVELRPNDHWQPTLLFNRYLVEESLQSIAGLRPTVGPFANQLVGRVVRNEWSLLNTLRFPFDFKGTLKTSLGFDTGKNISDNPFWKIEYQLGRDLHKYLMPNWTGTWYANYEGAHWHFDDNRLGNGGASLTVRPFGLPLGSDGISPIPTATNPGTGGYFSPDRYLFQALRLGNRGDFWNKRLIYNLSGYAGIQDISRFGTDFTAGVLLAGEIKITDTVRTLFGANYQKANPFDQATFYIGLQKRI